MHGRLGRCAGLHRGSRTTAAHAAAHIAAHVAAHVAAHAATHGVARAVLAPVAAELPRVVQPARLELGRLHRVGRPSPARRAGMV